MSKSELVTHVAARAFVSKATADAMVSAVFSTIGEALARDETVVITAFGTFTTRAPRNAPLLFGLFTSAANTAYFPSAFLRPTDFSFHLRSLVQRRAQHLYSDVCLVLPPGLELQPGIHPSWEPERFQWNPPVGQTIHVPAFLEYRRRRIDELLRNRADALRSRSDPQNPDA